MVRGGLRSFISSLGHDPILSEYNDVLFNPDEHTHESCLKEIKHADMVVLIIGSRFGGRIIPQALTSVDTESFSELSQSLKILDKKENLSITQVEVLKAIELDIPVFIFVDNRVLADHLIYEKNKDKPFINEMEYASIDKKDTAIFIFEFLNFLRHRVRNNSLFGFSKISDIEDVLRKQWSALLQNLLENRKNMGEERKLSKMFLDGIQDIKSLIMTTISTEDGKEIGKGVLTYRRMLEFFISFQRGSAADLLMKTLSWSEMLKELKIKDFVRYQLESRERTYIVMEDGTFYTSLFFGPSAFVQIPNDWEIFRQLPNNIKEGIIEAIIESSTLNRMGGFSQPSKEQFSDYIKKQEEAELEKTKSKLLARMNSKKFSEIYVAGNESLSVESEHFPNNDPEGG